MKRSLAKIAAAILFAVLLAGMPMVYHWRPLVPSLALSATYEQGSERHAARVYRMLLRDVVFVELPEDAETTDRWFAVDLRNRVVTSPNGPTADPYLHHNHDMSLGVPINDTLKRNGEWSIRWGDDRVTWSDGKVTVHLHGA